MTYALGVSAAGGVDSGLVDTLSGDKIYLFLDGEVVKGLVGNDDGTANAGGAEAFTIGVITNTGVVTLTQIRAIVHDDINDHNEDDDDGTEPNDALPVNDAAIQHCFRGQQVRELTNVTACGPDHAAACDAKARRVRQHGRFHGQFRCIRE